MSSHFDRPSAPKPYAFVPIAAPQKATTVGHERILGEGYVSGRLDFQLRALTPVFVGSGSYALGEDVGHKDEPVIRACYRVDGVPAIPGSSLKGVVRSVAEAISPSCVSVTRPGPFPVPQQLDRDNECTPEKACPACSMFGRMNRMSKVFFEDAYLVRGHTELHHLPALYAPRVGRAYQDERGQIKGRKFYYHGRPAEDTRQPPVEVLVKDSRLQGSIRFENLSEAELGLLFFSLGLNHRIVLKLGGGKPYCLGSVLVQPGRVEMLTADRFVQADPAARSYEQEELAAFIRDKMQKAVKERLILRDRAIALREILRPEHLNSRDCPDIPY